MIPDTLANALLIVVSAPSGAGKTTLCQGLLAARPDLTRAVTCTTRAPRAGEQDGVDYHFLDPAAFARRAEAGEFLEHAVVHGNRYGTLKSAVLRGALVTIFLTPPSFTVLEERLRKRGTDTAEAIARRLSAAREEMAHWNQFDYLLVSGAIPEDLRRALGIVESEKMRALRSTPPMI
jgi:guanylate kinase